VTTGVGQWPGPTAKMPRPQVKLKLKIRAGHLKYAALTPATLSKYEFAVKEFFVWVLKTHGRRSRSRSEFDWTAGEYVNFLFQQAEPYYKAGYFLSGLKRLYPESKRALSSANAFYKNWLKLINPQRAWPLSSELTRGMAVVLWRKHRIVMASLFLVAFVGLFRIGELLEVIPSDLQFCKVNLVIFSLRKSKGALRRGSPELVQVRDRRVCDLLRFLVQRVPGGCKLFPFTYCKVAKALKLCAKVLGVESPRMTPHAFRRGGATDLFRRCNSYDALMLQGRWSQLASAKLYVDLAMADKNDADLPKGVLETISKVSACLQFYLDQVVAVRNDNG
jgi:integrase